MMPVTLPSNKFSYEAKTKIFFQEMSMLDEGGRKQVFCQIYNDSCDEGFTMISSRTGESVDYVVNEALTNDENEILAWHLIPTPASIRRVPSCKGTQIHILND